MISTDASSKSRIVVDTDVASYLFNGHTQAEFFRPFLLNKTLAVSFVTVGELFYGAYKKAWGLNKRTALENTLKNYVILPYDYDLCLCWAQLRSDNEGNGHCMGHGDCWIAATALRHDCALATNNGKHFAHVKGLSLISPSLT